MDLLDLPKLFLLSVTLIKASLALLSVLFTTGTSNQPVIERTQKQSPLGDANVGSISITQEE